MHVIYNGVNLERIERSANEDWTVYDHIDADRGAFLIGTAGMLTEQKAHDVLIRAVARARRQGHDIELAIAGDGELREYLGNIAADEGVADSVHFLGLIDRKNVYRLISEVEMYAMPSRWEGFSAAAIEALALGAPCLYSNISEFTKPFANVAAFHRVDNVGDLSARIVELKEDDEWRRKLGAKGQEYAPNFSLNTIAQQYRDLYMELQ